MAVYPGGKSIFDAPVISGVPADADRFMVMNNSATLLGHKTYSDIKSYFIKTYADSQVDAHTTWADNCKAKFGTTGQMELYYDTAASMTKIKNTISNLPMQFFVLGSNSITILLQPSNKTIQIGADTVLTPDAYANKGIKFDSSGNTLFGKNVILNGNNIKAEDGFYSYDGTSTGMSVDSGQNFLFSNDVTVTGQLITNGLLDLNAHMATGTSNISYTGANGTGLEFSSINNATFNQSLHVDGAIVTDSTIHAYGTYIKAVGYMDSEQYINADLGFKYNSIAGITATINLATASTIVVKGGIITGIT